VQVCKVFPGQPTPGAFSEETWLFSLQSCVRWV